MVIFDRLFQYLFAFFHQKNKSTVKYAYNRQMRKIDFEYLFILGKYIFLPYFKETKSNLSVLVLVWVIRAGNRRKKLKHK